MRLLIYGIYWYQNGGLLGPRKVRDLMVEVYTAAQAGDRNLIL
jgi:hypothetical protein